MFSFNDSFWRARNREAFLAGLYLFYFLVPVAVGGRPRTGRNSMIDAVASRFYAKKVSLYSAVQRTADHGNVGVVRA